MDIFLTISDALSGVFSEIVAWISGTGSVLDWWMRLQFLKLGVSASTATALLMVAFVILVIAAMRLGSLLVQIGLLSVLALTALHLLQPVARVLATAHF
jgi:hypothetical protein